MPRSVVASVTCQQSETFRGLHVAPEVRLGDAAISGSGFQGVNPLAVLTLAGQETAQGMRLPACRFDQLPGAGSARPPHPFADLFG